MIDKLASHHNPFRWHITIAVMLVAVIEVLDMTIVNVALPHMMGTLGANSEQITWVLTSYIVSSAICMPLTGFLVKRLGQRRLLLINIIGFLAASMLCGTAVNLPEIVFFRTLQGIFGASLVPMSQYVLTGVFPPEERGKGMAIWGVGIMAAPVLGPTLGGYITESMNWRWIFYLNIPVCIIALYMTLKYIPESKRDNTEKIDWLGLILMAVGIGAIQVVLDRGNEKNWFSNNGIIALSLVGMLATAFFITRGLKIKHSIVNLRIFHDRNFTACTLMMAMFGITAFGIIAIQPIMLENFMNYPTETTGMVMAPRGIASAIAMLIIGGGGLLNRFDPRRILVLGLIVSATGTFLMSRFNLQMGMWPILSSGFLQGLGMGMFFVPLSTILNATLNESETAEATGLYNFGRGLGSSIGISILSTVLTRETQINWNRLGGHMNQFSSNFQHWLQNAHLSLNNPHTLPLLGKTLYTQASMVAFVDCYRLATMTFLLMLPLVFLMQRPPRYEAQPAAGH